MLAVTRRSVALSLVVAVVVVGLAGSALFAAWTANASADPAVAAQRCGGSPRPLKPTAQVKADIDGDGRRESVFVYHSGGEWRLWSATSASGTVSGLVGPRLSPSDVSLRPPVRFGNDARAVVPTVEATMSNTETVRLERLDGCHLLPLPFVLWGRRERALPFAGSVSTGFGVRCIPARSLVVLDKFTWRGKSAYVVTWTYRVGSRGTAFVSKKTKRYPASNRVEAKYESLRCRA